MEKSSKKELVEYLKKRNLKSSFPRKQDLLDYLKEIQWASSFPWRPEQQQVIDVFMKLQKREIIGIQGLFGCGKTTLLLGMLNLGYWNDLFKMDEICFCAFNVCIKDEIKKKIRKWGCKDRVIVRTFDSLIYEFCKYYEYPHLKLPNYKGKRLFIYEKCRQSTNNENPYTQYEHVKYLFVDECQDLERTSFDVFRLFFPNASIIFVGDIFQSVQKEPRESLLWYVSQVIQKDIHYFYMQDTPRVPKNVLGEIQSALQHSYPEYSSQIMNWKSSNHTHNTSIEWISFSNYRELYQHLFTFLDNHPLDKSMILTFSSSITVRGTLGDLARVRRLIQSKGYPVNTNHKSMNDNRLFLSTANSSKGLERDFVFIMSTFPLERAFINFSNDLTTNLVTVALSRAKQKVFMCVPTDTTRFSCAFQPYMNCPRPSTTFVPTSHRKSKSPEPIVTEMTKENYLNLEHNVTELLRQNIIEYDTRILFKEYVKKRIDIPLTEQHIPPIPKECLGTEEERSFVGVCLEVLMTSLWTNKYPDTPSIDHIRINPYYQHCISKIQELVTTYGRYKGMYRFSHSETFDYFKTIFLYTELHIAIHHKMFFFFNTTQRQALFRYWKACRSIVYRHRPNIGNDLFKCQMNVKMPLLTGIADGVLNSSQKHIYEIKASLKPDWREDAFIQAFCYALMLGQKWFHIELFNLFKNAKTTYVVYLDDDVKKVRQQLSHDILIWNVSSYLAKTMTLYPNSCSQQIENYLFLNVSLEEILVVRMLSPTRIHIDFYDYAKPDSKLNLEKFKSYINNNNYQLIYCCNDVIFSTLDITFPQHTLSIHKKWSHIQQSITPSSLLLETLDYITQILHST